MRTALIFRERLLAPSETFIVEQARSLRHYHPILVGLRRTERRLDHSLPQILHSNGSGFKDKLSANLYRKLPMGAEFFRLLRAAEPSVIHAHFATDAIQALPIARKLNLPLIVSLHGFDVTSTDDALRKSFSGRHFLANRGRLFAEASVFLCVSSFIREAALRAGFPEEKLRVHYTGIDCDHFRPTDIERDHKLVLFVGRLVEKKGCEYLLRAMHLVQQLDPEIHVEIIGDGPLRSQLETLAARLALRVRFRGVQNSAEVLRSMSRARILCNPSVTAASGDMEGFGMVFAEAQAVGTPVVSFAHAAIPEAVNHGETGLLCPERAIEPLAASIQHLLGDDHFWSATSTRAAAWVRAHFDITKQSQKLEAIYDDCAERRFSVADRRRIDQQPDSTQGLGTPLESTPPHSSRALGPISNSIGFACPATPSFEEAASSTQEIASPPEVHRGIGAPFFPLAQAAPTGPSKSAPPDVHTSFQNNSFRSSAPQYSPTKSDDTGTRLSARGSHGSAPIQSLPAAPEKTWMFRSARSR
jgi:colanic acid/amylovoran biosynthesis glycosyltransferase